MQNALVRYRNLVADSVRFDDFEFRDDDIIISTPPKCGTTWTQTICALLIFQTPDFPAHVDLLSPWLEQSLRSLDGVRDDLAAQTHRRFIKSHTPMDGLPFDERVTYICVGRDPRDVALSWDNHMSNLDIGAFLQLREKAVGNEDLAELMPPPEAMVPPPLEVDRFWRWVDATNPVTDDLGSLAFTLHHLNSFFVKRDLPNVVMLHYGDMKDDLEGQMRALATRLGIDVPEVALAGARPGRDVRAHEEPRRSTSRRTRPRTSGSTRAASSTRGRTSSGAISSTTRGCVATPRASPRSRARAVGVGPPGADRLALAPTATRDPARPRRPVRCHRTAPRRRCARQRDRRRACPRVRARPSCSPRLRRCCRSSVAPAPASGPTPRSRPRLPLRPPRHVTYRSPAPASPTIVSMRPPSTSARRHMSCKPTAKVAARALAKRWTNTLSGSVSDKPSHMPTAIAVTFLYAAAISAPGTSSVTIADTPAARSVPATEAAASPSDDAHTIAVGAPATSSGASAGPARTTMRDPPDAVTTSDGVRNVAGSQPFVAIAHDGARLHARRDLRHDVGEPVARDAEDDAVGVAEHGAPARRACGSRSPAGARSRAPGADVRPARPRRWRCRTGCRAACVGTPARACTIASAAPIAPAPMTAFTREG